MEMAKEQLFQCTAHWVLLIKSAGSLCEKVVKLLQCCTGESCEVIEVLSRECCTGESCEVVVELYWEKL